MELGQTESLCLKDDHHRGVGHIYSHLNHGCGNEHLCLAADEALHLLLLVLGFHLAVYLAHAEFGEHLAQNLKAVLKVLEVDLLALLNKWEDYIHLSAHAHLTTYAFVEAWQLGVEDVLGLNGFATGRQFVNDTHVEVAIERHSESAGNRCGCHHEHVGRSGAFAP